jgi:hypothetical protein
MAHGPRSNHDETPVAARSVDRSRLRRPQVAELLQVSALATPDHVPRVGVAMKMMGMAVKMPLKLSLDLLERAAGAALFVICVEWFVRFGSAGTGIPVDR